MHYVYVLKSAKDHHLYYGYTNDLNGHMRKHKDGKVFSTKSRLPVALIYYEAYTNEGPESDTSKPAGAGTI